MQVSRYSFLALPISLHKKTNNWKCIITKFVTIDPSFFLASATKRTRRRQRTQNEWTITKDADRKLPFPTSTQVPLPLRFIHASSRSAVVCIHGIHNDYSSQQNVWMRWKGISWRFSSRDPISCFTFHCLPKSKTFRNLNFLLRVKFIGVTLKICMNSHVLSCGSSIFVERSQMASTGASGSLAATRRAMKSKISHVISISTCGRDCCSNFSSAIAWLVFRKENIIFSKVCAASLLFWDHPRYTNAECHKSKIKRYVFRWNPFAIKLMQNKQTNEVGFVW